MGIYACSDIHGQYKLYKKMLEGIHFGRCDHLYILGDVIDRGPANIRTLRHIMKQENVICLMGNHELMMYDHLTNNFRHDYWFSGSNGGEETFDEYENCKKKDQEKILRFIRNMYLQVELDIEGKKFLLSHSSFVKDKGTLRCTDIDEETVFNAVWDSPWRRYEYKSEKEYKADNRIHVIGHVPVQHIYEKELHIETDGPQAYVDEENHIINIDLGCARLGNGFGKNFEGLCCMNLEKYARGEEDAFTYFLPE